MDTYEEPLGVTWKATTPEHAAARVFGGKPEDYMTFHVYPYQEYSRPWGIEVQRFTPNGTHEREYVGEIPYAN